MMPAKNCDGITRRGMLQVGTLGLTGLSLSSFLRIASAEDKLKAKADSVIFINLAGGPSHLETLDMKPDGPVDTRGEFKPIQSKLVGLQVCEYMPEFARVADQFTLLRGISHTSGSHPLGQSYISTGNRPTPALIYPSLGSVVGKELGGQPDLPPFIAIPKTEWNAGYLGDANAPLNTNASPKQGVPFQVRGVTLPSGLSLEKVDRREQLLKQIDQRFRHADTNSQLLEALDKFGQQAHHMIISKRSQKAFDVSLESPNIRKLFAPDELGQSMLLAARLVGFGVKFVTVTNAGWDTHLDNFTGHKRLIPPLDAGLAALVTALKEKGQLERTLIVCMGEFGRTPKINENAGRDHYPRVNWALLAGGGVKAGQIIGGTNSGGTSPNDSTDIKPDDIAASIYHSLGIDCQKEYHTTTGRPVMIVPHGRPIKGLFA